MRCEKSPSSGVCASELRVHVPSSVMETVAICPACGQANEPDAAYCLQCRIRLDRAEHVSPDEAEARARQRRFRLLLRRALRWGLIAAVAFAAGFWAFWNLGPGRSPPVPSSDLSSVPRSDADWPMLGRDPSHTGLNTWGESVPEGKVVWRLETAAPFESYPAVVDGTVYVSTGDKRVMALNAESGEVVWETDVGGPVASSPAVAGDLLYVGLRDNRVIALSTVNGEQVWEHLTRGYIVASPTVREGIVYIGSSDERLYALDARTGEEFWSFKADGRLQASPAVSDEVIGIVTQGRAVHILEAVSGRLRLDFSITGESIAPPALDDDLLYAADSRGAIVGVDWRKQQVPFEKLARFVRTQLFVWQFVGTLPPPKGYVWNFRARRLRFQSAPALGHGHLFAASDTGILFALDRSNGELAWRFQAEGKVVGSPSVADDYVYFGDSTGTVYEVDALSGDQARRFTIDGGGEIVSTPVIAGGTMFVTDKNGVLYAIR